MRGSLPERFLVFGERVSTRQDDSFVCLRVQKSITTKDTKVHEGKPCERLYRWFAGPDPPPDDEVPTELGIDSDSAVFSAAEKRAGCGRYPLRVRTL